MGIRAWVNRRRDYHWPNKNRCRTILRAVWAIQEAGAYKPDTSQSPLHQNATGMLMRSGPESLEFRWVAETDLLRELRKKWEAVRFDMSFLVNAGWLEWEDLSVAGGVTSKKYRITPKGAEQLFPFYQRYTREIVAGALGALFGVWLYEAVKKLAG